MFKGILAEDTKVYATTAANEKESSSWHLPRRGRRGEWNEPPHALSFDGVINSPLDVHTGASA